MGNHHTHGASHKVDGGHKTAPDNISTTSSKKGISRTSSGADIQERIPTQLMPVENLAKILLQKSQEEDAVNGITKGAFVRWVFPKYTDLGERLFQYLHAQSRAKTIHLGLTAFKQQSERFLAIMNDDKAREAYVMMYSESITPDDGDENSEIRQANLRNLLMTCYRIAMDHYCEGPQTCIVIEDENEKEIHRTINSVVESCFHSKQTLSTKYVTHWMEANCPRLLLPLHRFSVHALTTAYRVLEIEEPPSAAGLNLTTPVLDKPPAFPQGTSKSDRLMPVSQAWLLASALPQVFSRPLNVPSMNGSGTSNYLASHMFLSKLLCTVPSHWLLLYNSDLHGQGTNRFLHHVMAYRGPTLTILRADERNVYCIASPCEWRESHQYWGDEEAAVIQLLPKFLVLERGAKIIYLNTTIRGYPKGLRAGKDPRKPVISVDVGFEKIEFKGIPYNLLGIEVWGCGDLASREKQLDIKNWQVKEVERQRQVKLSAADWLDHPDRYLLQLAGRPNYSENQS